MQYAACVRPVCVVARPGPCNPTPPPRDKKPVSRKNTQHVVNSDRGDVCGPVDPIINKTNSGARNAFNSNMYKHEARKEFSRITRMWLLVSKRCFRSCLFAGLHITTALTTHYHPLKNPTDE